MLSLVATPIGNLEDITLRAIQVLTNADLVVCEDTRRSGILMKHLGIKKPLLSFHSHSSKESAEKISHRAINEKIVYISDAGTPGISDPAYLLVQAAIVNNAQIEVIPGATAFLTALIGSGMHTHDFRFLGFLPLKKGRKTLLEELKNKKYTAVIYESPHRISKTLAELITFFGPDHPACLARELTKIHESYYRKTLQELYNESGKNIFRGEIVLIF